MDVRINEARQQIPPVRHVVRRLNAVDHTAPNVDGGRADLTVVQINEVAGDGKRIGHEAERIVSGAGWSVNL
jgi:hypothetical protein